MRLRSRRPFAALLAFLVVAVAALASPAFAQDYTVTSVSGQLISPPGTETAVSLTDDSNVQVSMPFDFPYFGSAFNQFYLHSNGYVQLGTATAPTGSTYSNTTFPPSGGTTDAMVAPMWDDLNPAAGGVVSHWVAGTAPNRICVVHWAAVAHFSTGGPYTFQIQLHETSGRIVFAYDQTTTAWVGASFSVGIRAPSPDNRYVSPDNSATLSNRPTADYQFDPRQTLITGTVLFDAVVADGSGYGNSVDSGVPAAGLGLELRDAAGKVVGRGTCDESGVGTIAGLAIDSSKSGSIWASLGSAACRVSASSPGSTVAEPSKQIVSSVAFSASTFPTVTLNDSNDSNANFRKYVQIASAIGNVYFATTSRTSVQIPRLEVYFDDAQATELTKYVPSVDGSTAYLRVGGSNSGNLDAFDTPVVMRAYSRHIVHTLWGLATTSTSMNLDAQADVAAAAADGIGLYLHSLLTGAEIAYDATSTAAATAFDLESPSLTQPIGTTVGGWWAAALYDTIDAANEAHDAIDGTQDPDGWRLYDELVPLSSLSLVNLAYAWDTKGYDAVGLVRNLVRHGVLADDASESDDTLATAFYVGDTGFRFASRTLNPFNEDWYRMTLPVATDQLFADTVYAQSQTTAELALEIRNAVGGAVIATGAWDDSVGAFRAVATNVPAGDYLFRVAHVGGGPLGAYGFQAFARMVVDLGGPSPGGGGVREWTLTRTFNAPAVIDGGIPPFSTQLKTGTSLPPGLSFDGATGRIFGNPQQVGTTKFTLITSDAAEPQNRFTLNIDFKVNPQIAFAAPVLTGIAVGKAADVNLGRSGGTDPVTVSDLTGELPDGLQITDDFRVQGTTAELGGSRVGFTVTDVAGSSASLTTTLVACAGYTKAKMPVDLGGADAAAGFYFDALEGASTTITMATAKKRAKRALTVVVVGPDGAAVPGGKSKIKPGSVSIANLPLPLSGRYFVLFSGADAGAATQMLATLKTKLPAKGAGAATLDFNRGTGGTLGALNGTTLTINATSTGGMGLRIATLRRPDGTLLPLDQVKTKVVKTKTTFTVKLDQSGTWQYEIRPTPGPVGDVKYTFALKHPKGVVYTAD